jgi:hypothetical protein
MIGEEYFSLKKILKIVKKHKLIIVGGIIVGVVVILYFKNKRAYQVGGAFLDPSNPFPTAQPGGPIGQPGPSGSNPFDPTQNRTSGGGGLLHPRQNEMLRS